MPNPVSLSLILEVPVNILDEVQLGLMEMAAARDNYADYGRTSYVANQQLSDGVERITKALQQISADAVALLLEVGESEGHPGAFPGIERRTQNLAHLVAPQGALDQLLDQLDGYRELLGRDDGWVRRNVRSAILSVRVHLRQVCQNYERIAGRPIEMEISV